MDRLITALLVPLAFIGGVLLLVVGPLVWLLPPGRRALKRLYAFCMSGARGRHYQ